MKYSIIILSLFITISAQANTVSKHHKTAAMLKQAEIVKAIAAGARKAGVPQELLTAICWVESNHRNVGSVHDGGSDSFGICQIKLETAQDMDRIYKHQYRATKEKLLDPYLNAFYAGKYLKYQLDRYDGNWKQAVDAYNKGTAVSAESKYVKKVMKHIESHKEKQQ